MSLDAHDAADDLSGVDADTHLDTLLAVLVELLDGLDHGQSHVDGTLGVVRPLLRAATHAVVAVAQRRYLLTPSLLRQPVEPAFVHSVVYF